MTPGTEIDWTAMAADVTVDSRPLLHGQRVDGVGGSFEVRSPRDGRVLCEAAECGDKGVDAAVAHARAEQLVGCWPRFSPTERGLVLGRWADAIEAEAHDLALLVSLETGKPIRDALNIDLAGVVRAVRWYAALANKLQGEHPEAGSDDVALVSREAIGVTAIMMPWNFPLAMVGYDVAPALVLGNSVVVKPSEQTPLAALRCCELAVESGVSRDALNVITGTGPVTGQALSRHPDVDSISVTGFWRTGRAVMRASGESNGKRVWTELGGKSAGIVFDDASNLQRAAHDLAWGAYFNQGEMCTGTARLLVQRGVYDEFLAALCDEIDSMQVGDPLSWQTTVGALTTERQLHDLDNAVREAVDHGATVSRGGNQVDVVPGGCYYPPTLLTNAPVNSRIYTEEVFGPIAAVRPFDTEDEALDVAFSSGYGMGVSVWTSNINTAFRVTRRAKVGLAWINCFERDDLSVPAGGVGRSGYGRTKGSAVLDKYTNLKTTWVRLEQRTV